MAPNLVTEAGIRADPSTRLPGRVRRRSTILRDAGGAWVLAARAPVRIKLLALGASFLWGLLRMACLTVLLGDPGRLHGTAAILVSLYGLSIVLDTGPVLLAGAVMPPLHRRILGAPGAPPAQAFIRAAKLTGVLFALVVAGLALLNIFALLPALLIARLGRTSTLLTLILLLPAAALALAALLRLSLGLPAIALGLPRALAEGWAIARGRTLRAAAMFAVALLPPLAAMALFLWWRPHPLSWPALILRPVIDLAFVALTASLTGLLYRDCRLPLAFRPDRRPSRNPAHRKPPVLP